MRSRFRIDNDVIRYIATFRYLTGVNPVDCMVDDEYDRVIFVVASGRGGRAIGKNGNNIKKVRESIRKEIDVVEHSENINEFIMNIFRPVSIHDVEIIESVAYIKISRVEKGIAIGRGGRNIQKAKTLVQKYYGLDDIIIR